MKRILLPAALAALFALPSLGLAQQAPASPRIVVTGDGEATLRPDMALLSLGTLSEAPTASEALAANSAVMAAVLKAMKEDGIAERDLQTAGVQINPRYEYTQRPDGTQEGKLVAYQVTNTVSIRVRDVGRTGAIIDRAVSLGANNGGGISFANEDPKPALKEARKMAVADAVEKAKTLAEAAGVQLGRVTEINDTVAASPPIPIAAKAMDARSAGVPVEAGENAYSVQVNMTFELK